MAPTTRAEIYEDLKERRRRGEMASETPMLSRSLPDVLKTSAANMVALEICALADRVFGDEAKADAWLVHPNTSMSGQRPVDLMQDQLGAAVVRETLEQIDHGIFA